MILSFSQSEELDRIASSLLNKVYSVISIHFLEVVLVENLALSSALSRSITTDVLSSVYEEKQSNHPLYIARLGQLLPSHHSFVSCVYIKLEVLSSFILKTMIACNWLS